MPPATYGPKEARWNENSDRLPAPVRRTAGEARGPSPVNSLFVIAPYRHHDLWVFDDPAVGLRQEPFVGGADTIVDALTEQIPGAPAGFRLIFSGQPFPGHQVHFHRVRADGGGTWYRWPERGMDGWLCPALFKYFTDAPADLFVQASPLKPGKKKARRSGP